MPIGKGRREIAARRLGRALRLERLEDRNLFAALPLGAVPRDTGEFMLGRVAVVPLLFESNGQLDPNTENWTASSIQSALTKVEQGVQWWSDALARLGTVHELEFVIDDQFARNPIPTPYELISRPSQFHSIVVGTFLEDQGYGEAGTIENAIRLFNNDARTRLNADWAFSIVIVNSANDAMVDDGQFGPGSEFNNAFAYPGGQYVVTPSTRPVSTITHEVGHIFWARDEYPGGGSWTDRRGYYNAQNWNAADNTTAGFVQEPSIMRSGTALSQSFSSYVLPESTMAMIGWRDSDGDGIFDVSDVPLRLEGTGRYDAAIGTFAFDGFATAVALPNLNSAGLRNDITLNRIDRIEYRLDGGAWQTAQVVGKQASEISFQIAVGDYSTIEIRAIDDRVGITSAIYRTDMLLPMLAGASVAGLAFVNAAEGETQVAPHLLAGVTATLVQADGSPLFSGMVEPDHYTDRITLPPIDGVSLVALGHVLDGRVGSVETPSSTGSRAFGFFSRQSFTWQQQWAPDKKLLITFDQPVGSVQLDAIGLGSASNPSFGRLEAFDAAGNLLTRFTTSGLSVGQTETMQVNDAAGRIASVQAFGHSFTQVGLDHLRYGAESSVTTTADGVFGFSGIPDGTYRLTLTPERLIHQFPGSGDLLTVQGGVVNQIAAGFQRVRSPWNNPGDPFDVDGNTTVEPLDALVILTEIARNGTGILRDPAQIEWFVDPNDDGEVSPLDALWVLNEISRRNRSAQGEQAMPSGDQTLQPGGEQSYSGVDAFFAGWAVPEDEKKRGALWSEDHTGYPDDSISTILS
ncbi:MAG TPA: hypothetical protein DDZ51_01905 [Planctomycetaceae bacterium]|nr:hypothetical protein [Planctomycetaceae bacterium]